MQRGPGLVDGVLAGGDPEGGGEGGGGGVGVVVWGQFGAEGAVEGAEVGWGAEEVVGGVGDRPAFGLFDWGGVGGCWLVGVRGDRGGREDVRGDRGVDGDMRDFQTGAQTGIEPV